MYVHLSHIHIVGEKKNPHFVNCSKTTVRTPTWLSGRQVVKFKMTGVGTGGRILDLSLEISENNRATFHWDIYANQKMLFCSIPVLALVAAVLC